MNWSFLSNPYFYSCLLLGMVAMIPRIQYIGRKLSAGPQADSIKPNLGERVSLLIPSVCVIYGVTMLGNPLAGLALLVVYLSVFVTAGLMMRGGVKHS
ncbi:MAG: hypothetical protein IT441_08790 [Phycisphaeraceae bacterium]|nr:hypothetical protein [Phycisphaeraceae bacterium]